MILKTEKKIITLVLTTRKIVDIAKKAGCKNFEEAYFKAINEKDLEQLSKIVYTIAETEDGGKAFISSEEVYDFIDEYMKENKKTYEDLFNEITEAINEEGFFMKKMTKEELQEVISSPLLNMNMNELVRNSAEKAITQIAQQEAQKEFQGYKG